MWAWWTLTDEKEPSYLVQSSWVLSQTICLITMSDSQDIRLHTIYIQQTPGELPSDIYFGGHHADVIQPVWAIFLSHFFHQSLLPATFLHSLTQSLVHSVTHMLTHFVCMISIHPFIYPFNQFLHIIFHYYVNQSIILLLYPSMLRNIYPSN